MSDQTTNGRVRTSIRNLDEILHGGLPKGSAVVVSGPPGSGKTILSQQIAFSNASASQPVVFFNTLSEPTAKTLRYLNAFEYFDPKKLEHSVHFVDLGIILRSSGMAQAGELMMRHIKKLKPAIVVIDSFKMFDDLAKSREELRKFSYELAVQLMAWEVTAFLLGEYGPADYATNPLFSVVDGLIVLTQRESGGEQQRFCRVLKMRGTDHNRDEHPFRISSKGIEVFAPRATIRRVEEPPSPPGHKERCRTGIAKLDELLGEGIPWGSSLLVSGAAGTGKTVVSLEFILRGALQNEPGIFFSFEETTDRLRATAAALGWDMEREIARGMIEIISIPPPDILVEAHLLMMHERVQALHARRVAIDSVSVFLHKVENAVLVREKLFQLATIVQNAGAVGFFATDIPYGSTQLSRFGIEETVVDGVILLSAAEQGLDRQRYIEIYKLRNTNHRGGRHPMAIGPGGIEIVPRKEA